MGFFSTLSILNKMYFYVININLQTHIHNLKIVSASIIWYSHQMYLMKYILFESYFYFLEKDAPMR